MPGAADLVVRGALAAGASMIRLTSRGEIASFVDLAPEVVHASDVDIDPRCRCVVAGPGLGTGASDWLRERLSNVAVPVTSYPRLQPTRTVRSNFGGEIAVEVIIAAMGYGLLTAESRRGTGLNSSIRAQR